MHGYTVERKDFYNLVRSPSHTTKENKVEIALVYLSMEGFHVRYSEKYVVENDIRQNRIIELFFFCSPEQIQLARQFVSGFIIENRCYVQYK